MKCGAEQPEGARFCPACVSPPLSARHPHEAESEAGVFFHPVARCQGWFALAGLLLVVPLVFLFACTGETGPETVARRAVQALIDGSGAGYLNEVRPDNREWSYSQSEADNIRDVRGCTLDGAQALREIVAPSGVIVTFVFHEPCGTNAASETNASCRLGLTELGDRWYLDSDNLDCRSSGQAVGEAGRSPGTEGTPNGREAAPFAGVEPDVTMTIESRGAEQGSRYEPATLTAKAGQTVEIILKNSGSVSHNIHVAGADRQYDTLDDCLNCGARRLISYPQAIEPGKEGRVVLKIDEPGTYPFRCDFHPDTEKGNLSLQ